VLCATGAAAQARWAAPPAVFGQTPRRSVGFSQESSQSHGKFSGLCSRWRELAATKRHCRASWVVARNMLLISSYQPRSRPFTVGLPGLK